MGIIFAPPQNQPNLRPSSAFLYIPPDYPTYTTPGKIKILWENNVSYLINPDAQPEVRPGSTLLKIPPGYFDLSSGRSVALWEQNQDMLFHKLSPYTEYSNGILSSLFGSKEPFYYVYPNESKRGINGLRRYESRAFPIGSAPMDVIRVSKFMVSGRGVGFLAKQFLLQTQNVYNETRIYNPLSPIVASGMTLGLGTVRPLRHLDIYGGIGGIANSLLGGLGTTIFGPPKINPAPGSVRGALPKINETTGGKGLLRASTANKGKTHLDTVWVSQSGGGGFTNSFKNIISGVVKSLFGNFIPQTQSGIKFKSDEGTYGKMLLANHILDADKKGYLMQRWVAGGTDKIIRKGEEYPNNAGKIFSDPTGRQMNLGRSYNITYKDYNIGYDIDNDKKLDKGGIRYGDVYGLTSGNPKNQEFFGSDMMIQWGYYQDANNQYKTKQTDKRTADALNQNLKDIVDNIQKNPLYYVNLNPNSTIIRSSNNEIVGYDRLMAATNPQAIHKKESPLNYKFGLLKDYEGDYVVDNTITTDIKNKSRKLPTNNNFDALNTLTVLDNTFKIDNSKLKGWDKYDPYVDDQIAFYFYDIVNTKYIPFRATINGLSENGNAQWDELQFIGRSDKVYSYGGFTRNLTFSFTVNMGSIAELGPTYQRLNYLSTLIKPANYTSDVVFNGAATANRFAVAPMIMLNIGDLYKDQPVIIQNIGFSIPEDALWETLNDKNQPIWRGWKYLASQLKATHDNLYAQVPRTIEVQLTCILLEKERPIAGGANFGHAPRITDKNQNWKQWNVSETPSNFHQNLVVDVVKEVKVTAPIKLPKLKMIQPSTSLSPSYMTPEQQTNALKREDTQMEIKKQVQEKRNTQPLSTDYVAPKKLVIL